MENGFHTTASRASVLSLCVVCVSTMATSLPHPCIHDLKDIFLNCPGPAHFQAKGWTRNKFLFDNNKMLFSPPTRATRKQATKMTFICYLRSGCIQLCFLGVMIRSQDDTFGKPCGFNKGWSSSSCHLYCYFFGNCAGQVNILYGQTSSPTFSLMFGSKEHIWPSWVKLCPLNILRLRQQS